MGNFGPLMSGRSARKKEERGLEKRLENWTRKREGFCGWSKANAPARKRDLKGGGWGGGVGGGGVEKEEQMISAGTLS